jgi:hypothetical protein
MGSRRTTRASMNQDDRPRRRYRCLRARPKASSSSRRRSNGSSRGQDRRHPCPPLLWHVLHPDRLERILEHSRIDRRPCTRPTPARRCAIESFLGSTELWGQRSGDPQARETRELVISQLLLCVLSVLLPLSFCHTRTLSSSSLLLYLIHLATTVSLLV